MKSQKSIEYYTKMAMLFDFYGETLTKKQSEAFYMHYCGDLSLSEIGCELGITRQAAGILINKAENALLKYEERIGVLEKHINNEEKLQRVALMLKGLLENPALDESAKNEIAEILNDFSEETNNGV